MRTLPRRGADPSAADTPPASEPERSPVPAATSTAGPKPDGVVEAYPSAPPHERRRRGRREPTLTPKRMWTRGSRSDRVCLAGIGVHLSLKLAAVLGTAYLLARPLLHLATVGALSSMVGGGAFASEGKVALWAVLACALIGAVAFDFFYWWAGQRWQHQIPALLKRTTRVSDERIAWAKKWMHRHGFWFVSFRYFQPLPNAVLQVLAGASGMSGRVYGAASLLGASLIILVLVGAGYLAGEAAVAAIELVQANAVKATVGIIAVAVVWQFVKRRRSQASAA